MLGGAAELGTFHAHLTLGATSTPLLCASLLALARLIPALTIKGDITWKSPDERSLKSARVSPSGRDLERTRSQVEPLLARTLQLLAAEAAPDAIQEAAWVVLESCVRAAAGQGVLAASLVRRIAQALLAGQAAPSVLRALMRLATYSDVRYHVLRTIVQRLEKAEEGARGRVAGSAFVLLKACPLPPSVEDLGTALVPMDTAPENPIKNPKDDKTSRKRGREAEANEAHSYAAHRRQVERAWQLLTGTTLSPALEQAVLLELVGVLGQGLLTAPLLLHGWLSDLVGRGGAVAPLALHALFLLMTRHGLDYPQFYSQLYALLDAPALVAPERARLLRLTLHFLQSPLLPAYLVCAFVKRMARLALTAPPDAVQLIITFIFTVLQTHVSAQTLVHQAPLAAPLGALQLDSARHMSSDPFDPSTPVLADTRAQDSSLWELHALMAHWAPTVSARAKLFKGRPGRRQMSLEETEQQQGTFAALWGAELARKVKRGVPLAYERSPSLRAEDWPGWSLPRSALVPGRRAGGEDLAEDLDD